MNKLLELCDMFSCTLDGLVRGDLAQDHARDAAGYDAHMNGFSRRIAAGVGLLLLGLAVSQGLEGLRLPEAAADAALFAGLIPAVILFVVGGIRHSEFVKKHPHIEPFYPPAALEAHQRRFPVRIAAGVGLILCGVLLAVLCDGLPVPRGCTRELYDGGLFLLLAAGAPVLVYAGMQKSKYDVEAYNNARAEQEKEMPEALQAVPQRRKKDWAGKACGVISMLTTAAFLIGMFAFDWENAWVVFPVGGLLCAVAAILLDEE